MLDDIAGTIFFNLLKLYTFCTNRHHDDVVIELGQSNSRRNLRTTRQLLDAMNVMPALNTQTTLTLELPAESPSPSRQLPISSALENFINIERSSIDKLSTVYDAAEYRLRCPISLDFPQIPVRFNGNLYDYEQLMRTAKDGCIIDPGTREKIPLLPHVIQPDFAAQEIINKLLNEMAHESCAVNNNIPIFK